MRDLEALGDPQDVIIQEDTNQLEESEDELCLGTPTLSQQVRTPRHTHKKQPFVEVTVR